MKSKLSAFDAPKVKKKEFNSMKYKHILSLYKKKQKWQDNQKIKSFLTILRRQFSSMNGSKA